MKAVIIDSFNEIVVHSVRIDDKRDKKRLEDYLKTERENRGHYLTVVMMDRGQAWVLPMQDRSRSREAGNGVRTGRLVGPSRDAGQGV